MVLSKSIKINGAEQFDHSLTQLHKQNLLLCTFKCVKAPEVPYICCSPIAVHTTAAESQTARNTIENISISSKSSVRVACDDRQHQRALEIFNAYLGGNAGLNYETLLHIHPNNSIEREPDKSRSTDPPTDQPLEWLQRD